jgi:hypothetical protein
LINSNGDDYDDDDDDDKEGRRKLFKGDGLFYGAYWVMDSQVYTYL